MTGRTIRRLAGRAAVAAAVTVGVLSQVAPASAAWFIEMGPFPSRAACDSARTDLMDSGIVQPCFTRDGAWYFKFSQNT